MKDVIWAIHEIRYWLAKWRAGWHIVRTNAMIRIMQDAVDKQIRLDREEAETE